jgi:peptide/nickel transport system permease protein
MTAGAETIGLARADRSGGSSIWRRSLSRFGRDRMGIVGLVMVVCVLMTALGAPIFTPYGPSEQQRGSELVAPSAVHPLGTDEFGRDILARVFYGGRASFTVGILSVVIAALVGTVLGLLAAYRRGWTDYVVMRLMDIMLVLPPVLWGIAVIAALGKGLSSLAFAVALTTVPQFARMVRASALVEAEQEYITAARATGCNSTRIMARHILPNVISPLIVQTTLAMAFAIQLEAGLSFLGLGVQPPQASWGLMLSAGRMYLSRSPWYGIFPGLMLALLLAGLNFLADAIRRVLDPRRLADIK